MRGGSRGALGSERRYPSRPAGSRGETRYPSRMSAVSEGRTWTGEIVESVVAERLGDRSDGGAGEADRDDALVHSQGEERGRGRQPSDREDRSRPFEGTLCRHPRERGHRVAVPPPAHADGLSDRVSPTGNEVSDDCIRPGQHGASQPPDSGHDQGHDHEQRATRPVGVPARAPRRAGCLRRPGPPRGRTTPRRCRRRSCRAAPMKRGPRPLP